MLQVTTRSEVMHFKNATQKKTKLFDGLIKIQRKGSAKDTESQSSKIDWNFFFIRVVLNTSFSRILGEVYLYKRIKIQILFF